MMSTRKVLGRGLEALIPVPAAVATALERPQPGEKVFEVATDGIEVNPFQPRKHIDDDRLRELSDSIKADGVLQPVVVRRKGSKYELIMGERRLQAARLAGVATIPVVVRDVSDADALRLAIVENIQRENLNPIEEAQAYRRLISEFSASQADVAGMVGKDRSSVANTIRLLNLPEEVQGMIQAGTVSAGHARALLALTTQKEQIVLARRIVEENMSVRQVESIVGLVKPKKSNATRSRREKPAYLADLEKAFATHLGTRVSINEKRGGKGSIAIEFYSYDDFERLSSIMNIPLPR
ncbi:MAG TPA: ParB/RepB/Spo0J family partition protein [Candidatus Krumholzibacteria bacterium]|jgi:ParB family chromosome partitioning protein|nr:ParB/RepB/Spo0J family partition protein [Candidatus Krumholzibacteria bacterium]